MFKYAFIAALSAVSFSASAQGTFESTGLGEIDPWGVGALARNEGALPNTLWQNSDPEILSDLMARTNPRALSPAARELVARAVLSSARRPAGDNSDDLLRKRLKIIENLGDIDIYSDFVRQSAGVSGIVSPFELSIDQQFARGNLASACSTVRASSQTSAYILNARAVCMALEGNIDSAELALEFARAEGSQDIWLVETIGVMGIENPKKRPEPKYDSGLKLALSLGAKLDLSEKGLPGLHPALASELTERTDVPRSLRIQAADVAAFSGVMSLEDYRHAYRTEPVRARAIVPTITGQTIIIPEEGAEEGENPNVPVNPLDEALQAANNAALSEEEKASLYSRALMLARPDLDRFRVTSAILLPELRKIRSPELLARHGEVFALAAMVAEDPRQAARFVNQMVFEGGPEPDEFLLAWLDGIQIISGRDRSPQSSLSVTTRLAETADGRTKDRAARMIHMIMTLGGPVSPEGRKLLSEASDDTLTFGIDLSPRDLLLTRASLNSGAQGEGTLRAALMIGRDASALNMFDLAGVVQALKENGFDDIARDLALEGIRYHRPRD